MPWLIEHSAAQAMQAAVDAGVTPTAEQQVDFSARAMSAASGGSSRIMVVAGDTAEIAVQGVLTAAPDFLAMLFGGGNTTFSEVIAALAAADQDPAISKAHLAIDSPGGSIDGLFDTLAALEAFSKPLTAVVSNKAASAAFAIAAKADKIVSTNRATRFGSIGVVVDMFKDEDVVSITSTEAPNKRPDVSTEAGRAVIREELDALHELFVEAIADGRETTVEKVNSDFGRGGMFLADEALKRGMIDSISGAPALKVVDTAKPTTAATGGNEPEANMDLQTLKAQHPAVFSAAKQEGVEEERDRVGAHLQMGEASGDMKTACAAIKDGSGMTATLQATYMTAGMNRADVNARQQDDVGANGGDGVTDNTQADAGDAVAVLIESRLGIEGV